MMISGQLVLTAGRLRLKYQVHQATEVTVDCPKRKLILGRPSTIDERLSIRDKGCKSKHNVHSQLTICGAPIHYLSNESVVVHVREPYTVEMVRQLECVSEAINDEVQPAKAPYDSLPSTL